MRRLFSIRHGCCPGGDGIAWLGARSQAGCGRAVRADTIPAGTYSGFTVTGNCTIANGALVQINGNLTVGDGAT